MLTFAAAVFFLIVTPGPGVLSAAGVGAAYGFRSGLRWRSSSVAAGWVRKRRATVDPRRGSSVSGRLSGTGWRPRRASDSRIRPSGPISSVSTIPLRPTTTVSSMRARRPRLFNRRSACAGTSRTETTCTSSVSSSPTTPRANGTRRRARAGARALVHHDPVHEPVGRVHGFVEELQLALHSAEHRIHVGLRDAGDLRRRPECLVEVGTVGEVGTVRAIEQALRPL